MIIVTPVGGLANRMRVISAGYQLAVHMRQKLIILWELDEALNCPFDILFEPVENTIVISSRIILQIHGRYKKLFCNASDDEHFITRDDINSGEYFKNNIRTCHHFFGSYGDLSMLHPQVHLINEASRYVNSTLVGLHIRRTDHQLSIDLSPLSLFENAMGKEIKCNPDICFFLATDDSAVEEYLSNKYPGKIVCREKERARNTPKGIIDALIDLLILSKTIKIYGSHQSSFGHLASVYGQIPFVMLSLRNTDF